MSNLPSRAAACALLGIPDRELVDIFESPAGPVFVQTDGNSLIDVDPATPDFEGKSGLMFLVAPPQAGGYRGSFPVFVNDPDSEPVTVGDGEVEAVTEVVTDQGGAGEQLDKDALLARAKELGLDHVKGNWGAKKIAEAIAQHEAGI